MQGLRGGIVLTLAVLVYAVAPHALAHAGPTGNLTVEPLSPIIEEWNLTVAPNGGYTLILKLREPPPCNDSSARIMRDSTQDITPLVRIEVQGENLTVRAGDNLLTRITPGHHHLITLCNISIARVSWPEPAPGPGREGTASPGENGTARSLPPTPLEEDIGVMPLGEGGRHPRVGFNPRMLDLLPVLTSLAALVSAVIEYARRG